MKELGYLGSVSGRDEAKIEKMNLHVGYVDGVPYIDEANKVLICKKLFAQHMPKESSVEPTLDENYYGNKDYHDCYIGGIQKIMVR